MTERELKKLKRSELLEMLLELSRENEQIVQENQKLQAALNERRMTLEKAGSIADAAMAISNVFQAAQEAADLYLANVRAMAGGAEPEEAPAPEEPEYNDKTQRMLEMAREQLREMNNEAPADADEAPGESASAEDMQEEPLRENAAEETAEPEDGQTQPQEEELPCPPTPEEEVGQSDGTQGEDAADECGKAD